jgi:hypothetical protein
VFPIKIIEWKDPWKGDQIKSKKKKSSKKKNPEIEKKIKTKKK